jgi:hypothetical protein
MRLKEILDKIPENKYLVVEHNLPDSEEVCIIGSEKGYDSLEQARDRLKKQSGQEYRDGYIKKEYVIVNSKGEMII